MTQRKYPYIPKNTRTNTPFFKKWGILAKDLALEEGTTSAAIHMRVFKWSNPFQRKSAPTICEIMTGRTAIDLALELDVTPCSIAQRIKEFGDPYRESIMKGVCAIRGTTKADQHWTNTQQGGLLRGTREGWLSPRHPEYATWRYKYIQKHCPTNCDTDTGA